jgi:hypothetical protein
MSDGDSRNRENTARRLCMLEQCGRSIQDLAHHQGKESLTCFDTWRELKKIV